MRLQEVIAKMSYNGKPIGVDHPDNQSIDFQDGFAIGYEEEKSKNNLDTITEEYQRRGQVDDDSFKEWKRGLWMGIFTKLDDTKKGE